MAPSTCASCSVCAGDSVTLNGLSAFDAAVHCAQVSAIQRSLGSSTFTRKSEAAAAASGTPQSQASADNICHGGNVSTAGSSSSGSNSSYNNNRTSVARKVASKVTNVWQKIAHGTGSGEHL